MQYRSVALARYPLAIQTLSALLLNFEYSQNIISKKKVDCALSDFCLTLTYLDATKIQ